jgi:hypothetical protein
MQGRTAQARSASSLRSKTAVGMVRVIAVGTPVTRRPPHGSERALLTHSALTLDSGLQALTWIGVLD